MQGIMEEKPILGYRRNGGETQAWERLEIYQDGRLHYRSKGSKLVQARIPTDRVMELLDVFSINGFDSMPSFYHIRLVQDEDTDTPMEHELTRDYQGKRKSVTAVVSGHPPEIGPREPYLPERFHNITSCMEEVIRENF